MFSLLPKVEGQFTSREYWNQFFKKQIGSFEWYGSYWDHVELFSKYCRKSDAVLILGCGNSDIGLEIAKNNGVSCSVNVDFDVNVIRQMKQKHANKIKSLDSKLIYEVADVLKLNDDIKNSNLATSYQCIVDKGTFDALYSEDSILPKLEKMLDIIDELLSTVGRYVVITLAQSHILDALCDSFLLKSGKERECIFAKDDDKCPVFSVRLANQKNFNYVPPQGVFLVPYGHSQDSSFCGPRAEADLAISMRLQSFLLVKLHEAFYFPHLDAMKEELNTAVCNFGFDENKKTFPICSVPTAYNRSTVQEFTIKNDDEYLVDLVDLDKELWACRLIFNKQMNLVQTLVCSKKRSKERSLVAWLYLMGVSMVEKALSVLVSIFASCDEQIVYHGIVPAFLWSQPNLSILLFTTESFMAKIYQLTLKLVKSHAGECEKQHELWFEDIHAVEKSLLLNTLLDSLKPQMDGNKSGNIDATEMANALKIPVQERTEDDIPKGVEIVTSDMKKYRLLNLIKIVRLNMAEHNNPEMMLRQIKVDLDRIYGRAHHCFLIKGRYCGYYSHETGTSIVFKTEDEIFVIYKSPDI
ncbi:Methyltransferase-like protein 13 [Cichlidogyrus casuarinus]|uniref:Methyltransferase-like protein 13 n=1 Tax=Cichlidogyrus casuarinus TaxID=1844966 RepID=A0ABD2QKP7_9PLAT